MPYISSKEKQSINWLIQIISKPFGKGFGLSNKLQSIVEIRSSKPASAMFFLATLVCPGKSTMVIFTVGSYFAHCRENLPVFPPTSKNDLGLLSNKMGIISGKL